MTLLQLNNLGSYNKKPVFADPVLQTGGILINDDAYTAGLTYTYDVRGFSNAYFEVNNEGSPANSLDYKIEKCRKNYTDISTLVDGDFDEDEKVETAVASGARDTTTLSSITPEITALRIRFKRTTTTLNATVNAIASFS